MTIDATLGMEGMGETMIGGDIGIMTEAREAKEAGTEAREGVTAGGMMTGRGGMTIGGTE